MFRKCLVCVIVVLFLGISITPIAGSMPIEKSSAKPLNSLMQPGPWEVNWTINGTMGDNGWYISPITFTCTYDHDNIAAVYYMINYNGWQLYTEPFTVYDQGRISFMWYWVDYHGNVETPHGPYIISIDYTPPVIQLTVEKIGFMKWKFTAIAGDNISGVEKVEFYLDNQFLGNATSLPYEWLWTGIGSHTVTAIAYDFGGLSSSSSKVLSCAQSQNIQSNLNHIIQLLHNLIYNLLHHQMIKR